MLQLTDRKQYGPPDRQFFCQNDRQKLSRYSIMKKERNFLEKKFNKSPWIRSKQFYNPTDCFLTKNYSFFAQFSKSMKKTNKNIFKKKLCHQIDLWTCRIQFLHLNRKSFDKRPINFC